MSTFPLVPPTEMSMLTTTAIREEFDFDGLEMKSFPVKFKGRKYILVEASGGTVAKYRTAMLGGALMEKSTAGNVKVSGMGGLAEAELVLLAGCLCFADDQGNPVEVKTGVYSTVPIETLRAWPNRVLEPLAARAKEISAIDEKGEDDPKGSPPATLNGS